LVEQLAVRKAEQKETRKADWWVIPRVERMAQTTAETKGQLTADQLVETMAVKTVER
jgi:type IV secretory pathway VirD2 relaxase